MTLGDLVAAVEPLANSKVAASIAPVIMSSMLGAVVALVAYHFKSKESLAASVTWQWMRYPDNSEVEEPFISIQNRSNVPSYLKRVRLLRGNFIKIEAAPYIFSFAEYNEGNYPLEIKPLSVSSFPLSMHKSDQALLKANWINKAICYLFKRDYIWIEATTISGRCLVVPANDSSNFKKRPLWIDMRWFPPRKSDWTFEKWQELRKQQQQSK